MRKYNKIYQFLVLFIVVTLLTSLLKWSNFEKVNNYEKNIVKNNFKQGDGNYANFQKTILLWNSFWDYPYWEIGIGRKVFENLKCPYRNCAITMDKSKLNISSAVLFHIHQLTGNPPSLGNSHQKRVFFMLESPAYSKNDLYRSNRWEESFHWTMTYRMDSTIPIPYGSIKQKLYIKPEVTRRSTFQYDHRKLLAVMTSNCNTASMRSGYINQLQKYIPIDHYGRCGNMQCGRRREDGDRDCLNMINSTYKFYLAFENALCKNYITEKFFKILPLDVVPVVRGGADYFKTTGSLKWFINTMDFASPKALAKYLLYLSDHPAEYNRYLKNRELFEFRVFYGLKNLPAWCDLCALVNNEEAMAKQDTIDVGSWWNRKTDCFFPNDLPSKSTK